MENLNTGASVTDLKGMGGQKVDKINLAQDSEKWRMFAVRNTRFRLL